jgi:hypothetical protein
MKLISAIADLFVTTTPERENEKLLSNGRLALVEAECELEAAQARVAFLRARIERLAGVVEVKGSIVDRPARSSIQAPHPGPARSTVGAFTVPDAVMARSRA